MSTGKIDGPTIEKVIQDIEEKRKITDVQKFEYLFVSIDPDFWKPVLINGIRVKGNSPNYANFANQMGELGWELINYSHYHLDSPKMIFKRPK